MEGVNPPEDSEVLNDHKNDETTSKRKKIKLMIASILWLLTFIALVQLELAGPFVLLTALLIIIYYGTSSGKARKKTELSAYSVFNPNCVRLEGTLTAEQLESEILRKQY